MKNGMFDGFAREFEAIEIESKKEKTASLHASCKVGFWGTTRILSDKGPSGKKQIDIVSIPHGKWSWLTSNAPDNVEAICPEGVYSAE